ncbi:MAG: hypothetical protein ABIP58_01255 [Dehalococcoidia bacterium]
MPNPLYSAIDAHFLAPEALRRAALLARHGRAAAEGWFKVEMIALLDSLTKDGTIDDWRSDYPITEDKKQRCDFRLVINGKPLWLEVKTLIDPARQAEDVGFMGRGAGFADDLVKLMRAPDPDREVLLFVLPRPAPDQWKDLLATYARRIAPLAFEEMSDVATYPDELYVCKLGLKEMF